MDIVRAIQHNVNEAGIETLASEYVESKAPKSNYRQYKSILGGHANAYLACADQQFPTPIKFINTLTEYTMDELNVSSSQYFTKVKGLIRRFWKWMYVEGYSPVPLEPELDFKLTEERLEARRERVSIRRERVRSLTPEIVTEVIDKEAYIDRRTSIGIFLAYNIGCRLVELTRLQRKHFLHYKEGPKNIWAIQIEGKNDRKNHGDGYTLIRVPKEFYNYALWYMDDLGMTDDNHYVFPKGNRKGRSIYDPTQPAPVDSVRAFIKDAFRLHAGLDVQGHDLRRARVTELKKRGCNVEQICKLCRMTKATVERHYDYSAEDHQLDDTFVSAPTSGSDTVFSAS